jgi:hypothetical protein
VNISYKPQSDRGVTQLMYMSDSEAVDKAVAAPSSNEMIVGAIALIVALQSKGVTRLAAGGVAGYIGYRLYKARK